MNSQDWAKFALYPTEWSIFQDLPKDAKQVLLDMRTDLKPIRLYQLLESVDSAAVIREGQTKLEAVIWAAADEWTRPKGGCK